MLITLVNNSNPGEDSVSEIEVPDEGDVRSLVQMMHDALHIPINEMEIQYEDQPIPLSAQMLGVQLMQLGIFAGSILFVRRRSPAPPLPNASAATAGSQREVSIYTLPPNMKPEDYIRLCRENTRLLGQFKSVDPELGAKIEANDLPGLQLLLIKRVMKNETVKYTEIQDQKSYEANPTDPELRKKFEEKTRMENIHEQYMTCQQHYPESLGKVVMLYVHLEINNFGIKAFVDSGAQSTIMSMRMAEKCGIHKLIDERFAGEARGVGTAKILGRVHIAQMKFGNTFFPISITILENNDMDFLLGLDMLKRYRCQINLGKNCLRIETDDVGGAEEMEFLSENSMPESARGTQKDDLSPREGEKSEGAGHMDTVTDTK
jgi:predicted aspartyl protease